MSSERTGPRPVLFVHSSSGRYGADRQLRLIAERLDRSRYEPLVVLPELGDLATDLQAIGVEVLIRPLGVLRRELMSARGLAAAAARATRDALALARLIRARGVALVHSNTSLVLGGATASAAARVPHIWHIREIYVGLGRLWPLYRRLLGSAAALPCVSRAAAAQFHAGSPVRVIPDGLALDSARVPRSQARVILDLDEETPVIAVLGRISAGKGQDVLLRALARPELRERAAVALIAGDPWPGAPARLAALRRLSFELGVADRVRFIGFRNDVAIIYGAADIVAVPSTAPDPLPGAAIEAGAAGCVVLASDHGGLPEIVRDRETGRLVAPGDAAALARLAGELLEDPGQRERLGAAAAIDFRQRFSSARLLTGIHELYGELLRRPQPRSDLPRYRAGRP